MARYNKIRAMDISDGPGIRVSIFMQGCPFRCKGCFNKETWSYKGGIEFNDEVVKKIITLADNSYISGLSVLGGEPLSDININAVTDLVKEFKSNYPDKSIWVWTGNLYEDVKEKELFNYIDVLVDGQFIIGLFNPTLKYCGSSNQRVIDIKKSIEQKKLIIFNDDIK